MLFFLFSMRLLRVVLFICLAGYLGVFFSFRLLYLVGHDSNMFTQRVLQVAGLDGNMFKRQSLLYEEQDAN